MSVLLATKNRRKADAEQSVAGLMKSLEFMFTKSNSRNLDKLLLPLKRCRWKETPKLEALVCAKDFYASANYA